MQKKSELDVFLKPHSVTVIGATERPGSWGSFIMNGLLSRPYPGKIYPVNRQANQVFGIRAYREVGSLPESPDLAILTIPAKAVEKTIEECGRKGVKGISIITAGYGEAVEDGKKRERELVRLARSYGMRLLGPNVSGTFNLHAEFNGSASPEMHLVKSKLAAVCQGGYAIYDLLAHAFYKGMGVGKFVHTGNESDLTTTDFLEYLGRDPEVEAIFMYVEAIKEGKRFLKVAREVSRTKPVVMYKAGKFRASSRAAKSHTGALSGIHGIYKGAFSQANILISPTMELLLPLGHALIERPPMEGNRVVILTMGGSWGVALTDSLEKEGLRVPELSETLQSNLRDLGMPVRASVKNPVDIGASGLFFDKKLLFALGRNILKSGEADAIILHGMGRPGMLDEKAPERLRLFLEINKEIIRGYAGMEKEFGLPVFIGSIFAQWESQVIYDLNKEKIRIYDRLDEIAQILSLMYRYRARRETMDTQAGRIRQTLQE
ncbi:MAG: CoA-binding protein [Deltaproteobacteria bacterium]|nr:CoA-binding protein [Deltaproteobacteria bacterium]